MRPPRSSVVLSSTFSVGRMISIPSKACGAEHLLVDREIALGARGKPARQLVMADESGCVLFERSVAEHVVRMHVGVDHVADRLVGCGANRVQQLASGHRAAERVDHGDALAADDEARICHVAAILGRLHLVAALMHENPGRDLGRLSGVVGASGEGAQQRRRRKREGGSEEILARDQLLAAHRIMLSLSARSSRRECIARPGKRCESPKYRYRSRGFAPAAKPRERRFATLLRQAPCRKALAPASRRAFWFSLHSYTLRPRE